MMIVLINAALIPSDWVGRVIDGKFSLLEWVGSTESGAVFRTELQGPQSQRAVIRLVPADVVHVQAKLDDWAVAAALSHPHLMRIFDTGRCFFEHGELLYLVTEYAEEALSQVLPERPLTPGEVREMLESLLDALSYVHGNNLVYGHLKPSNVMAVGNQLKLPVDSLYRAGSHRQPNPAPQIYDAPEAIAGAISPAADVWSLGITLFEALTQHPPAWERSSNRDPVVPESLPQPFADIARKCLRHDPAQRCALSDIQALLNPTRSIPVSAMALEERVASRLPTRGGKSVKSGSATRGLKLLIGAVLVLVVVVAAFVMRPHAAQPRSSTGEQSPAPATAAAPSQTPAPQAPAPHHSAVKGEVAERAFPDVIPAATRTIHGRVNVGVRVMVDPSGGVTNAAFDSVGPSRYFSNQALEAARNWKFKPPLQDGEPVSSVWILRFEFRKSGTDITPVEIAP